MSDWRGSRYVQKREGIAVTYFFCLALAAIPPTLGAGYLLQLDMVFAPGASYLDFALAEKGPLYYGRLPFVLLLDLLTMILADWIVQRIILVLAIAGSGLAMYAATDDLREPARFFAGTLYAINPFIYIRLLAGQWYIVLAYALLPLAIVSFYRYVSGERKGPTVAILWTTLVAVFDPHVALILAVVGVLITGFLSLEIGRPALHRSAHFGVIAAVVNAYWLVPAGLSLFTGDSPVATIGGADMIAFSVRGSVADNVPLSVIMLYGFWRGGYAYAFDIVPLGIVLILFTGIFFLVIYGWLSSDDPFANALAVAGVFGGIFAVGVTSSWTAPITVAFVETLVGAGMRETGKFVAILAVAYAILGGRGIDDLLSRYADRIDAKPSPRAVLIVAILVVSLPLAYTFPMVVGFWGGFSPTEYPDDWHAANAAIESEGDHRILVLPWHQYIYFEWADRTVANPAPMFFGSEVISSHDPDLGTGSLATDPTRAAVRDQIAENDTLRYDEAFAELGIEYVVWLNVTDPERYAFLEEQPGFEPVFESGEVTVFHNQAFAASPPPEDWPADGSEVPVTPLIVGSALSLGAIAWLGIRHRQGGGS